MRIPQFRTSVYGAVVLGTACFFSPFGWGCFHAPLPIVNEALSFALYLAVVIAGFRTAQAWWPTTSAVRWPMLLLAVGLTAAAVWIGCESHELQQSSAHYQRIPHLKAVLTALGILTAFCVQETIRYAIDRRCRTDA